MHTTARFVCGTAWESHAWSPPATSKNRPIVPFSARYAVPKPKEHEQGLLATSWMTYVPGVAQ